MRKLGTRALSGAAVVAFCFAATSPAAAASGDVRYTATTLGATITSVFTNDTEEQVFCEFAALNEPYNPAVTYGSEYPFVFVGGAVVPGGQSVTLGIENYLQEPVLTIGQEVFVEWGCFTGENEAGAREAWGTQILEDVDDAEYVRTAETTVIVVGVSVVPGPPPVEVCTGSACLPTGSFGF